MNWSNVVIIVVMAAYLLIDKRLSLLARQSAPSREGFLATLAGVLRRPRSDP